MAFKRTAIPFFELANAAYASGSVSFFGVDDTTNLITATLITLYAGKTGATTVTNPYTLDSDGKFSSPVYAEERFIAIVTDADGQQHTTGIWEPALSTADVTAAAASATAAAASATAAASSATSASVSAVAAAASAALAVASVGAVSVTSTDATTAVLNTKLTVSAPLTKTVSNPTGSATLDLGVTIATTAQVLAKSSNSVILTPGSLAVLDGDTATTGLVRFSTVAEATTGTISTAAVTPAGLSAATANTVTKVALWAGHTFTSVTSAADVTMASGTRYRFSATAAAAVSHPTTVDSNYVVIVEMAPTAAGNTMTVKANGNTVDGVTTNDTYTGAAGPVFQYSGTAANTVRSRLIGSVPI